MFTLAFWACLPYLCWTDKPLVTLKISLRPCWSHVGNVASYTLQVTGISEELNTPSYFYFYSKHPSNATNLWNPFRAMLPAILATGEEVQTPGGLILLSESRIVVEEEEEILDDLATADTVTVTPTDTPTDTVTDEPTDTVTDEPTDTVAETQTETFEGPEMIRLTNPVALSVRLSVPEGYENQESFLIVKHTLENLYEEDYDAIDEMSNVYEVLVPPPSNLTELHLLALNDFHGRIGSSIDDPKTAQAVKVAIQVERIRQRYGEAYVRLISIGDMYGASQYESAMLEDKPTIDIFNALDFDFNIIGNRELSSGLARFSAAVKLSLFDHIVSNVKLNVTNITYDLLSEAGLIDPTLDRNEKSHQKLGLETGVLQYDIAHHGPWALRLIPLLTENTEHLMRPSKAEYMVFESTDITLQKHLHMYSEPYKIVAAHLGSNRDDGLMPSLLQGGEFSRLIVSCDTKIRAILGGHTHLTYNWEQSLVENGVTLKRPIVQGGRRGEYLVDIKMLVNVTNGELVSTTADIIDTNTDINAMIISDFTENNSKVHKVAQTVIDALNRSHSLANARVGRIGAPLEHGPDSRESALCNLVADAVYEAAITTGFRVDMALQNPSGVREGLAVGDVNVRQVFDVMPFQYTINLLSITGRVLKETLEQQWRHDGSTQRLCHSHMTYWYDPSRPVGSRIVGDSIIIDGEPIDMDAVYTMAVDEFLSEGGEGFLALQNHDASRKLPWVDYQALSYYIQKHSPIEFMDVTERAINKFAYVGDHVDFTYTAPAHNAMRAGERYTSEIVFKTPMEIRVMVTIYCNDEVVTVLEKIEVDQPYVFYHRITQHQAGPPDALIKAEANVFDHNPLGFGIQAKALPYGASGASYKFSIAISFLLVIAIHII
eukprot:Blabericola_migrator_1__8145@NODE_41_length_17267_cov_152_291279_g37_i0_p2_GENE_NODE_41_length_17267_cov_152_291279_g37_i0NODE_41_length_17267_cov_152_291279_g37_i0_p2_ORF_typecomplete_len887_score146_545_nucleotid_C/PF02872_18/1_5e31PT/PF04886_12/0_13BPS/PF08947_10/0_29_NODE_41_length_17267_cov_152_291279_g37_i01239615056